MNLRTFPVVFSWRRAGLCVSPLLLLLLWYWVSVKQLFPPQVVVAPAEVLQAGWTLWQEGELQQHLGQSLRRLGVGYLLGASGGLLFGVALARIRLVEDYLGPLFQASRQVPTVALLPVFVLLFGVEELFKIAIVTKAAFYTVALASYDGTRAIPRNYFEVARIYHLPPATVFARLIFPAMLPATLTGLRIALSRSWTILVAAEIIAAEYGLGQMMETSRQIFRLDVVMVGVVLIGLIGFALDRLLKLGERQIVRWQPSPA